MLGILSICFTESANFPVIVDVSGVLDKTSENESSWFEILLKSGQVQSLFVQSEFFVQDVAVLLAHLAGYAAANVIKQLLFVAPHEAEGPDLEYAVVPTPVVLQDEPQSQEMFGLFWQRPDSHATNPASPSVMRLGNFDIVSFMSRTEFVRFFVGREEESLRLSLIHI